MFVGITDKEMGFKISSLKEWPRSEIGPVPIEVKELESN
jgi:hypothetical protein